MVSSDIAAVFVGVLQQLERGGIPYMIVGSVGSIVFGEPRMTKDMDIVVAVGPQSARVFASLFPADQYYCPPVEVLRDEIVEHGQFNLIHHESGLKIDVIVRGRSPHAQEEFRRRRKVGFWDEFEAFIAAPEDIIIKKLEYFREGGSEKHLRDVRGILANTEIDSSYLERWIDELGLDHEWMRIGA